MWYQVHTLSLQGLNKSQIKIETSLDRATIRKYLSMSEDEFHNWISNPRKLPRELSEYVEFVKHELENYPDLSAAQTEDRLKEIHTNLPSFQSKTVYNLVQMVRELYSIISSDEVVKIKQKKKFGSRLCRRRSIFTSYCL